MLTAGDLPTSGGTLLGRRDAAETRSTRSSNSVVARTQRDSDNTGDASPTDVSEASSSSTNTSSMHVTPSMAARQSARGIVRHGGPDADTSSDEEGSRLRGLVGGTHSRAQPGLRRVLEASFGNRRAGCLFRARGAPARKNTSRFRRSAPVRRARCGRSGGGNDRCRRGNRWGGGGGGGTEFGIWLEDAPAGARLGDLQRQEAPRTVGALDRCSCTECRSRPYACASRAWPDSDRA